MYRETDESRAAQAAEGKAIPHPSVAVSDEIAAATSLNSLLS
jgi:hypothetical protein